MELMRSFLKKYHKIIVIILFPALLLLLNTLINMNIYYSSYRSQAIDLLTQNLSNLYEKTNSDIYSITNAVNMLRLDSNILSILSNDADAPAISGASESLRFMTNNYKIIDSVAVVNREQDYVVTNKGMYDFTRYFEDIYTYANYNIYFFRNFRLYGLAPYQCQPPTLVNAETYEKYIIPFIFCEIDGITTTNYIIVNIDIKEILAGTTTQNTHGGGYSERINILNRITGQCFSLSDGEVVRSSIKNDELYTRLRGTESGGNFTYKINGEKVIVVAFSSSSNLLDYCYYGIIPYSNYTVQSLILRTIAFNIVFILVLLAVVFVSLRSVISPLRQIENIFKPLESEVNKGSFDIFKYLEKAGKAVIQRNKFLNTQYTNALPLIQEKQLIRLLNSDDDKVDAFLQKEGVNLEFNHDYYAVVVLRLQLSLGFYKENPDVNSSELQEAFSETIQLMFSESFDTYSFTAQDRTIFIVLNLPGSGDAEKITEKLSEIKKILSVDKKLIQFYIGYGGIYEGLRGLKKAFNEAKQSLVLTIGNAASDIQYHFTQNDKQKLCNLLSIGHIDEARNLISSIISYNEGINVSLSSMKLLYINILFTLYVVMNEKNIFSEDSINTLIASVQQPVLQMYKEIFLQLDRMEVYFKNEMTSDKMDKIIKYIDENYSKDISLDYLSDDFKINSSQISKMFKAKTGITFSDYLAEKRINRAKELIRTTALSIQEIYAQVGFNNRVTFIRVFKKIVGLTPTEYSKSIKK